MEYDEDEKSLQVWHYIHASSTYDVERPMALWNATPEWYNDNNKTVFQPKPDAKKNLYKRDGDFTVNNIDLIAAGISLQRGKVPAATLDAIDVWLHEAAKHDRRALRVVNSGHRAITGS